MHTLLTEVGVARGGGVLLEDFFFSLFFCYFFILFFLPQMTPNVWK